MKTRATGNRTPNPISAMKPIHRRAANRIDLRAIDPETPEPPVAGRIADDDPRADVTNVHARDERGTSS
jgi:hypothetical protein